MKHYIDKNKEIFAFELDGSQDHLITKDMVEISLEEIQALNTAKEEEYKNSVEFKINEAKQYLADTAWYVERLNDPSSGKAIPEDVLSKRAEARALINSLEIELGGK